MKDPVEPTSAYSIRNQPEDFVVIEEPMYLPTGEGGHTFLYVKKRGRTTEQVANELARAGGVSARDVGYAGRKDRHALTSQWFSLPDVDPEKALAFELLSATVLEARRHGHKLKTGHLRGNRFEIVLRGQGASFELVTQRAEEILRRGLPNRYGEQRFGMKGDNANEARKLLAGGKPPRDRRAARFLISALQSEIFNAVLDERAETFDRVELGDLARVEESGGLFWVDDLERELPRAAAFEISATGPIFGTKVRAPRGYVAEIECRVFERFGLPTDPIDPAHPLKLKLPRGIRARGTRRPLRVRPRDLKITPLEGADGLRLECGLPSGAYLTVLLDALVGPVRDASRGSREPSPVVVGAGDSRPTTS
jgi:tRNA pseudouridine13 synthase